MSSVDIPKDYSKPPAESNSDEGEVKGIKRSSEEVEVHSANSWETADLGDDDRKSKFLRLMGASKKEHQGRFVIGETHSKHTDRSGDKKDEVVAEKLESQFKDSLEHRLSGAARRHVGLGFAEEENNATPCTQPPDLPPALPDTNTDTKSKDTTSTEQAEAPELKEETKISPEPTENNTAKSLLLKSKYPMFVKSSDGGK